MDLFEKEKLRLERNRLYQKRHRQRHSEAPKKPHPVPVHMTWEMRERLDYLVMLDKPPCSTSEFMRRAFEFYSAHLMGAAPPAEAPAEEQPSAKQGLDEDPPDPALEILPEPEPEPPPEPVAEPEPEPPPPEPELANPTEEAKPEPIKPPGKPKSPSKHAAKPQTSKPRNEWRKRAIDRANADAANRVPVRLEFTRKHHHIPHGMRQTMMDNGLQYRKNIWRGRLTPERAEQMVREIADLGGTLEITGVLGEEPKWGDDWGGGRRAAEDSSHKENSQPELPQPEFSQPEEPSQKENSQPEENSQPGETLSLRL